MQFQVPQFIEIEDKIFGPFTLKQFLYVAGGVGACLILFRWLPKILAFPLMIPILGLSAALAFQKINGKPFISIIEAWFVYITSSKLYVWKKTERGSEATKTGPQNAPEVGRGTIEVPKFSQSKLQELTWSLDIHETVGKDENSAAGRLGLKD